MGCCSTELLVGPVLFGMVFFPVSPSVGMFGLGEFVLSFMVLSRLLQLGSFAFAPVLVVCRIICTLTCGVGVTSRFFCYVAGDCEAS